ncbi:MAG: EAL domain-containing protein, partial [Desulfovibrio sp.]|nr:EAL domain-containing protein [Desulfovibrio sp.]
IFAGIVYFASQAVIIDGMSEIEVQSLKKEMQQLHGYIHALESEMSLLTLDWACWDEAYEYIHGRNDRFPAANLSVPALEKLAISSVAIYKNYDEMKFFVDAKSVLPDSEFAKKELAAIERTVNVMKNGNIEKVDGFIIVLGQPFLISAHRIYDSDKEKSSEGLIILTRKFDRSYINTIQHVEYYDFKILPADYFTSFIPLEHDGEFKILQDHNETKIYSIIPDIFGESAFCIELRRDNLIAALAKEMASRNFALLTACGVVVVCLGFVLLHKAELRFMRREVAYRTGHDSLTGLVNKHLVPERLAALWQKARGEGTQLGVLYINLNRFKQVNDSYGHEEGDELLKEAAWRLRKLGASGSLTARPGGDKFLLGVICEQPSELQGLAEKVLAMLHLPFQLKKVAVHVGASIGISLAPQDGEDARLLVHRAELAMHCSKLAKEDDWAFFTPVMEEEASRNMELESALYAALEERSLQVFYQPKVNIKTRDVAGCEALVRWKKKDGTFIPPPVFIPLAEECGLITEVDLFVLRRACRQVRSWHNQGCAVPVAVNMSVQSILTDDFARTVLKILDEEEVPHGLIELEITESCLMTNLEKALAAITELNAAGIHIALDDFGTGYSSLQYLSAMPISCLKIDKKFVDDIYSGKDTAQSLVKSILNLAANLGMTTVSEGVEEHRQLNFLMANGASVIQGYLFSKPLDGPSCGEFLR